MNPAGGRGEGRGGGGGYFTIYPNSPELIFSRRNCAVGMKLCIYKNCHKNFDFYQKICMVVLTSAFLLLMSPKIGIFHHFHLLY